MMPTKYFDSISSSGVTAGPSLTLTASAVVSAVCGASVAAAVPLLAHPDKTLNMPRSAINVVAVLFLILVPQRCPALQAMIPCTLLSVIDTSAGNRRSIMVKLR